MSLRLRLLASVVTLLSFASAPQASAGFGASAPVPIAPVRLAAIGSQAQVAAADNGTVTLFVWRDPRLESGDIFAARVARDGTVLDPGGIQVATGPGEQAQ